MDKLKEMKELMALIEADTIKFFEKDNKAAGVRARGYIQQLKKTAHALREETLKKD